MQIFMAMDYLILMPEKYVHFRKRQKLVLRNFFSPRMSNWIHVIRKYFSNYLYLRVLRKNVKEIGISKLYKSLR